MSALEKKFSAHQVDLNQSGTKALLANAISDLSVPTRIDYNLRFTKQAVLVVANNAKQYSQLASQYLVSLSGSELDNTLASTHTSSSSHIPLSTNDTNQINVAFVSASAKLNDIQIRCRLVEQLFVNTLFDPEQSLAVSVLKLAKQHGEAITIVIDHAHALSLQVKYELSHLVNQAKKHNLKVNVVTFGLMEAAHQLSINKSLFKNKIVIIDAESGQIINLDDNKINPKRTPTSLTFLQKISLITGVLILVTVFILGYISISDNFLKQEESATLDAIVINDSALQTEKIFSDNQDLANQTNQATQTNRALKKKVKDNGVNDSVIEMPILGASSQDINSAILALPIDEKRTTEVALANTADVLEALAIPDNKEVSVTKTELVFENNQIESIFTENQVIDEDTNLKETTVNSPIKIDSYYYENQAVVYEQGYVVQIAGFTDEKRWEAFIKDNSTQRLFSYQRLLNGKIFIVVTSKVYENKSEAAVGMKQLPESINNRNPWLKSISSVINEINTLNN